MFFALYIQLVFIYHFVIFHSSILCLISSLVKKTRFHITGIITSVTKYVIEIIQNKGNKTMQYFFNPTRLFELAKALEDS